MQPFGYGGWLNHPLEISPPCFKGPVNAWPHRPRPATHPRCSRKSSCDCRIPESHQAARGLRILSAGAQTLIEKERQVLWEPLAERLTDPNFHKLPDFIKEPDSALLSGQSGTTSRCLMLTILRSCGIPENEFRNRKFE